MKEIREVLTLRQAADDLKQGMWFYEGIEEGVGKYFISCLLDDIESLISSAGIHPMYFGYYRMLSRKFPFAVYYEIEDMNARIVAVLDMRRDPVWIRKQIDDR